MKTKVLILGAIVVVIWSLEIIDLVVFRGGLNQFGIRPRDLEGFWGILFAPFLHGDLYHVSANTVPFVILGWFTMLRGLGRFFLTTFLGIVLGGAGTWLIGAPHSVHIGLSGVIFAYLGFLMLGAIFDRSFWAIIVSIVVTLLYGGMLFGVLPGTVGISWEAHLCGFLSGSLSAKLGARKESSNERFPAR